MMTNNKILTVSYGTFSCTLEGFEDSFGTMKAIAEYFRDLSADDRYFGAEPVQPDAEMLARIAEREISRRVEAREQEGRIVLSAEPETNAAVAVASVAAAAPEVVAPDPPVAFEEVTGAAESDAAEVEATDEAEAEVADVAEIEEEIAAEVDLSSVTAAVDASLDDEDAAEELQSDDVAEETDSEPDTAEAFFADSTVDAPGDDAEEDEAVEVATAEAVEPETPPAPDSIAAKLQRIRAVVSQSKEDDDTEMFEDEHADAFTGSETEMIADAADEADDSAQDALEDAIAAVNPSDDEDVAEAMQEDDDDDVADILAQLEADTTAEATPEEEPAADIAEASFEEEAAGADSLAADLDIDTADTGSADNLFDAEEDGAPMVAEASDMADADTAAEENDATDAVEDEAPAPRRARIIKVKRADIDAALAHGQIEEVYDDEDVDMDAPAPTTSTLSEEEEAELQAELAAVSAELPATHAANPVDLDDAPVSETDDEAVEEKQVADADVSRLMAEADNQMEEPEGSRRRNAFQHLKAAVLAKKADAGLGDDSLKDEGAFRSDLASVVVPRRPAATGADRDERPVVDRPAPLKLVAEQRVDVENAAASGPVRPRRVAHNDEAGTAADSADGSFADYAADLGAHSLPDLLEAAASYLSFVEGHDQFSRPQLMTKVRQVEKEDFSREDGLRSFGQLLRAGKIEKRKGGRFTVTNDIGYRPDERAAG